MRLREQSESDQSSLSLSVECSVAVSVQNLLPWLIDCYQCYCMPTIHNQTSTEVFWCWDGLFYFGFIILINFKVLESNEG